MIEERLRETFARKEADVPAAGELAIRIGVAARRRRRQRWVVRSATAALAALLVAVGVPLVMARTVATAPLLPGMTQPVPDGPLNFLVVGLDRLANQDPSEPTRADVILIAHVPADRSGVQLVSISRDLAVAPVDGNPGLVRINSLYWTGGMALLQQQVGELAGITFQGTIEVRLDGLKDLVNELGPVPFCVDQETVSVHTGRTYPVGCGSYTGSEVVDLLRQRRYPDGALTRDRHNAQFLIAVLQQLHRGDSLADLARLTATYQKLAAHLTVRLGGIDPIQLAWQLRDATKTVAYTGMQVQMRPTESGQLVQPGPNAPGLFEALRTDTVPGWIAAHENDPLFE